MDTTGRPFSDDIYLEAVHNSQLLVLDWLLEKQFDDHDSLAELAVSQATWGGVVTVLEWAKHRGCDFTDDLNRHRLIHTIQNGHLPALQWLHRNGCPWDDRIISTAFGYCRMGDCERLSLTRLKLRADEHIT